MVCIYVSPVADNNKVTVTVTVTVIKVFILRFLLKTGSALQSHYIYK